MPRLKAHFGLFLKEGEWRFNYGSPAELVETLIEWHPIPSDLIYANPLLFSNRTCQPDKPASL